MVEWRPFSVDVCLHSLCCFYTTLGLRAERNSVLSRDNPWSTCTISFIVPWVPASTFYPLIEFINYQHRFVTTVQNESCINVEQEDCVWVIINPPEVLYYSMLKKVNRKYINLTAVIKNLIGKSWWIEKRT